MDLYSTGEVAEVLGVPEREVEVSRFELLWRVFEGQVLHRQRRAGGLQRLDDECLRLLLAVRMELVRRVRTGEE